MLKVITILINKALGAPFDKKLYEEWEWAKKITGTRPNKIKWSNFHNLPVFQFKGSNMTYFCYPNKKGGYTIGNVDTDGIFNYSRYLKKQKLIQTYLRKPTVCNKKEAVLFCVKATNIEKNYHKMPKIKNQTNLKEITHNIVSF